MNRLKKIKAFFSVHLHAASTSFNAFILRPFSSLMTVTVISIALTLPALFWMLTQQLQQLTHNWQDTNHVALYLKPELSSERQTSFLQQVKSIKGVKEAVLHSPEDALKEMSEQEGLTDIIHNLSENPFPAMIDVLPDASVNAAHDIEQLFEQLKNLPEVDKGRLDTAWLAKLQSIIHVISTIAHALMALLSIAVIFMIGNTLRLSISNHQEEIRVLKLIGATDAYIIRPFLYGGVWYGLFGAIFAVLLSNIFMLSLSVSIQHIAALYHLTPPVFQLSVRHAYCLVLFAVILGWIGARLSVLYFARSRLDGI